jgi:hypothetical protein
LFDQDRATDPAKRSEPAEGKAGGIGCSALAVLPDHNFELADIFLDAILHHLQAC